MSQDEESVPSEPTAAARSRIDAIVSQAVERWQHKERVDIAAIVASAPDLVPHLERRLREAEAQVASKASRSSENEPTQALPWGSGQAIAGEHAVHLHCPHCGNPIQLVEPNAAEVTCRVCGSTIHLDSRASVRDAALNRRRLGRFELLGVVGRGGFGVVYRARDTELGRLVAMKVPRLGYFVSADDEERFLREARSAARLNHPRIVPVYEVGCDEGVPYIVSALVEGGTLADLISRRRLPFSQTATLLADVAEAIAYAHGLHVIHRDIKPSNILLDGDGNAYVTDFGLARVEEGEFTITLDGQILGTAAYMSPEQAMGDQNRVDARSDVYSLGVMLYRLLTGELPFRGGKRLMLQQIIHEEPRPPRSINEFIPRDLETIALKAMAKEPTRRYQSAGELVADLRRWLQREPILARRAGRGERAWRWCRRRPLVAALLASIAMLLLAITMTGSLWGLREHTQRRVITSAFNRESRQRQRADDQARISQQRLARLYEVNGLQRMQEGDFLASLPWLVDALTVERDSRENQQRRIAALLRHCPRLVSMHADSTRAQCGAISPDGRLVACGYEGGLVALWEMDTGRVVATMRHADAVRWVAFRADGQQLVTASVDRTAQLWDPLTGRRLVPPLQHEDFVSRATFSPDGTRVVTASSDDTAVVWDAATGKRLLDPLRHDTDVKWAEFTPDGKKILTVAWREIGKPCSLRLFDAAIGKPLGEPMVHGDIVRQLAFSGDSSRFVSACRDKIARIWSIDTVAAAPVQTLVHDAEVVAACFAPGGRSVLTVTAEGDTRIWNASSGSLEKTIRLGGDVIRTAQLSPDGRLLALAHSADSAAVWQLSPARPLSPPLPHAGPVVGVNFAHEGRRLLTFGDDGAAKVWDLATEDMVAPTLRHDAAVTALRFDSKGGRFLSASHDGTVRVRSTLRLTEEPSPLVHPSAVLDAVFNADGARIATAGGDSMARIWDARTGKTAIAPLAHGDYVRQVRFSPDGRRLLTGCADGKARLWDTESGKLLFEMPHKDQITSISFSRDGKKIGTSSRDSTARVWDAATGRPLTSPLEHGGFVMRCAFNSDGTRLLTVSQDRTAAVWWLASGERMGDVMRHEASVWDGSFSPDDRTLVTSDMDGRVAVWVHDGGAGRVSVEHPFGTRVFCSEFCHKGEWILTGSDGPSAWSTRRLFGSGAAQIWDAASGDALIPPLRHFAQLMSVAISPDASVIITGDSSGVIRVWRLPAENRSVDELHRFARLLSGKEVLPRSGPVTIPATQLHLLWQSLRTQFPDRFTSHADEVAAWKRHLNESAKPIDAGP